MMMTRTSKRIGVVVLAMAGLAAFAAEARAERKNPLAGQPAVRRRYLINRGRFEISPHMNFSIAADLKHTIAPGLKVQYHLNDWVWIGGTAGFGAININTGLFDEVLSTLPATPVTDGTDRGPSRDQAEDRARTIGFMGDVHASFSPWFGKVALLGRWYPAVDLFFTGGVGFVQLKNKVDSGTPDTTCRPNSAGVCQNAAADSDPRNDVPDTNSMKIGPMLGAGMHFWFSKSVSLNIEFRDYIFKDNPSGFNTTIEENLDVNADDMQIENHVFAMFGVSIYFPMKVKVSR